MKFSFELPHDLIRALASAPNTCICLTAFEGKTVVNSSTVWYGFRIQHKSHFPNSNKQKLLFRSDYRKMHMDLFGAWWWSKIKFAWPPVQGCLQHRSWERKDSGSVEDKCKQHHMDQQEFCDADTSGLRHLWQQATVKSTWNGIHNPVTFVIWRISLWNGIISKNQCRLGFYSIRNWMHFWKWVLQGKFYFIRINLKNVWMHNKIE